MQCSKLHFKKAFADDSHFVWELANDPLVREVSFSSAEIPWEDHQSWFAGKISDEKCHFFIVEDETGSKVGQIRFELKTEGWVISLSIVNASRGKGLGAKIIHQGSELLFQKCEAEKIYAYIKNENIGSIRAFEKAGYKHEGKTSINSKDDAVFMVLNHH